MPPELDDQNPSQTPASTPAPSGGSLLDQVPADTPPAGSPNGDTPPAPAEGGDERFDFVLDRYRADGRTEQEAALEQAKGYNELRKQLGGFTGAPENYAINLTDDVIAKGIEVADDDPLIEQAREMAKELNMSQEGFDRMVDMYISTQIAEAQAIEDFAADQMKQLGAEGSRRLAGINQYINANYDAETAEAIKSMATTADSIRAIEALIKSSRNAPVMPDHQGGGQPQVTKEEVEKMLFEKDEHGQRRVAVDPEFRKEYERKRDLLWGTEEHRQMIR